MKKISRKKVDNLLDGKTEPMLLDDEKELDRALALANSYLRANRAVPSHIVTRIVYRSRHWRGREIPQCAVQAREKLQRTKP